MIVFFDWLISQSIDELDVQWYLKSFRSGTQSFHAVRSIPDWHRWAQGTLLDALYGTEISQGLLMKVGDLKTTLFVWTWFAYKKMCLVRVCVCVYADVCVCVCVCVSVRQSVCQVRSLDKVYDLW